MNIKSSRISLANQNTLNQTSVKSESPQQPPQEPKESFIPTAAAAVGTVAGGALGYYAGGTAGAYLGLLLTPVESGLGDALVNAAWGGVIGAAVGVVAIGTAVGVGAYLAAEQLAK